MTQAMYAPAPVLRAAGPAELVRQPRLSGQAVAVSSAGTQALSSTPWAVTFPAVQPGRAGGSFSLAASRDPLITSLRRPPQPPPELLEGIPDPASVERQKIEYAHGIDEMLAQQTALLAQKHQAVLDFLRAKNEQQKRHACAAIEQQRMKGEMEVQAKCAEKMMEISQAANRRKLELDKQANAMVTEYNARRAQEELSAQDYDLHLRFFSASSQPLPMPQPLSPGPGTDFADVGLPPRDPSRPPDYSGYSMPPAPTSPWPSTQAQTSPSGAASAGAGAGPGASAQAAGPSGTAGVGPVAGAASGVAAGGGPGDAGAHVGTLYLVVHGCYNLLNRDTGILGDVSDPFVAAKVGKHEEKTPTINNDLNPVWTDKNRFKFPVGSKDTMLELEVWNSNVFRNDSLGRAVVDLRALPKAEWLRRKEKLADGGEGELEFDVRLEPEHAGGHGHGPASHGAHGGNSSPGRGGGPPGSRGAPGGPGAGSPNGLPYRS